MKFAYGPAPWLFRLQSVRIRNNIDTTIASVCVCCVRTVKGVRFAF